MARRARPPDASRGRRHPASRCCTSSSSPVSAAAARPVPMPVRTDRRTETRGTAPRRDRARSRCGPLSPIIFGIARQNTNSKFDTHVVSRPKPGGRQHPPDPELITSQGAGRRQRLELSEPTYTLSSGSRCHPGAHCLLLACRPGRHARACHGHPRLPAAPKAWMAGSSPRLSGRIVATGFRVI